MDPLSGKINFIKKELNVKTPDVYFAVKPVNLDKLTHGLVFCVASKHRRCIL
jgi:hypothetical protein